jgi:translocation and assembly module TamA
VATATYTWTRKAVDKITDPTRGHLLTLSGTLGVHRDLQDSFVRLYGRYLYYLPLGPRDQLILRTELGNNWVDDPTTVPNDYLFRTGGVGSVRGYAYQSLGVRQGTATVGSRSLAVGSAEYVRWLTGPWGAAAFCDVGDAADDLRAVRLARGCGVGARWRSLAGPLALDLAYGERDRQWRLHFSIAIAY